MATTNQQQQHKTNPNPLLLPEILWQIGPLLDQQHIAHCVLACRTWNATLTPFLFQRVSLPRKKLLPNGKYGTRPMITALQRNGAHIRHLICSPDSNTILRQITPQCTAVETLVLGKITPEVLPILRLCRDTLTRLEMIPNPHSSSSSPSPSTLTQSYQRTLSVLGYSQILPRSESTALLGAILNLPHLDHLILDYLGLRDPAQVLSFFEYCKRLTTLELHNNAIFGQAPHEIEFNSLQSLSLIDSSMQIADQMMLFLQCPSLDNVIWKKYGATIPIQALSRAWSSGLRPLKLLDVTNVKVPDEDLAEALARFTRLENLIARDTLFGPLSKKAIIDVLRSTLEVLDVVDCSGATSEVVTEIMSLCWSLKSISADSLRVLDVLENKWVCGDLEELRVVFIGPSMMSKVATQLAIYNRIAALKRLRLLSLGRYGSTSRWSVRSILDLSLNNGLGLLATLTELREFDFCQMYHNIGIEELKFMVKSWPRLEVIHGILSADKDRTAFMESYLQHVQPNIRVKHNLKYHRSSGRD
ncbi:hypothetical protein BGZ95_011656 [Linnemannia exigua]|uniref:F-box domain-containing protein n=1 Tax=Linnemannia exigua TaxID=604196 RepID=A0AAD4DM22_9FUNG|nr:hypothetical protein BGZ95_011656 [Linnemannia exigua]